MSYLPVKVQTKTATPALNPSIPHLIFTWNLKPGQWYRFTVFLIFNTGNPSGESEIGLTLLDDDVGIPNTTTRWHNYLSGSAVDQTPIAYTITHQMDPAKSGILTLNWTVSNISSPPVQLLGTSFMTVEEIFAVETSDW
jgi:hypothetical protein